LCYCTTTYAQTSASFGVGASLIEYEGFLASGAATFNPALRVDARDIALGAQGSWTVFESGNQILQANAGAAWLSPAGNRVRLELSATGGASRYAEQPAAGNLLGRSRLHLFADRYGGWLTLSSGASFDSTTTTPLEIGIGAWSVHERFALVGTATAAWVEGSRHLELAGAARWTPGRMQLEARLGVRPWVDSPGFAGDALSGPWGDISALVPLTRQIALALSGGSYPSDPVRRVLGAEYLTAGFRVTLSGSEYAAPLAIPAELDAIRLRDSNDDAMNARLEIIAAPGGRVLRLHVPGAHTVEVMADFTDWEPLALAQSGTGAWEIQVPLSRGVHRLNIRVDGGAWLVPPGARAEADEFGGVVGVIVVQ
jgi:hypothetical protein